MSGRLVRLAATFLVLAAFWPTPAAAHDSTIAFTIVGDGTGRVRVAATWVDDGHLTEVPVVVFLSGQHSSDPAQRFGPIRASAVAGLTAVYELASPMPSAGRWTVLAESSQPALGRGQTTLEVGAFTGFPADFPPRPAQPEPTAVNWLPIVAATLFTGIAVLALAIRRRGARNPASAKRKA